MKVVSVFLACTVGFALAGVPWEPKVRPEDDDGEYFIIKHETFVNNTRDNHTSIRVLFYGDSITDAWAKEGNETFDQYYAPLGTANYGIYGDSTEHVLWRLKNGEVTNQLNPAVCVIQIGTNNIDDDNSNDENTVALGIIYNVIELRERLPNMKILVLGILPRNNATLTARATAINNIVKNLDNGNTIRFLDMKNHFYRGDGVFNNELYKEDLLHLSAAGYRKWAEVMDPLFKQMLGYTCKCH